MKSLCLDLCLLAVGLVHLVDSFIVPNGRTSVQTDVGQIVGYTSMFKVNGVQKVARNFLGIPYAEPPTGNRRFRKPVPKRRLVTPFDATHFGSPCYQFEGNSSVSNLSYSEDCLTLNIFAPEQSAGKYFPVLIAIHGGGFVSGTSYGADLGYFSVNTEMIIVAFNYRLNVFGFFSSNDVNSAGNFGLWDQQLAIHWVHVNILSFGGDASRITIGGESTGGVSVIYQMVWGTSGQFQRAIAQSGCMSCPWAFRNQNDAHNTSRQFATLLGCSQTDDVRMINCIQSKNASNIRNIMNSKNFHLWTPVFDNQFFGDHHVQNVTDHFAQDRFYNIDLIIGANNKEGLSYLDGSKDNITLSDIYDTFIPDLASYMSINGKHALPELVKNAIILEYTDWNNIGDLNAQLDRFTDLVTDIKFNVAVAHQALEHVLGHQKSTYVYKLSAAPPYHFGPVYPDLDGPDVAIHGDDLAFLGRQWLEEDFKFPSGMNITVTDEQRNIGKAITTMWANFVKTG